MRVAGTQLALLTLLVFTRASRAVLAAPQGQGGLLSWSEKDQLLSSHKLAGQYVNEGIRLAEQSKLSQAAGQFVEALRIDRDNTEAHYNLGLIRMKWGDLNAASSSFGEVLRIDPHHAAAQLRLASILTQFARDDQNYIPRAASAYARAIELDPTQPEAYFNLGYLAIRKREYSSAVPHYQKTLALDPHYPQVHLELGVSLYELRDFEAAYSQLQAAITEEPGSAEAHHYCGLVLAKRTQWDKAVRELRTAARLAPDEQEIHYALAEALRKSGHTEEAQSEIAVIQNLQAHSSERTEARFRDYQAKKSIEAGEIDHAVDDYRQSLELVKDPRTATNLGVALLWKGEVDGAIQALQRARDIDPKYEWSDYYLGISYARKREYEKAEESLNRALKLRPGFSEAEFYQGLVQAAEGRFQEAESHLRAAVSSRPDAAATHYYLGSILLRLGREQEGRAELRTSRQLDPGFDPGKPISSSRLDGNARAASNRTTPPKSEVAAPSNLADFARAR